MKKAIAALLASFVGLFGYQIVDKALEARVGNLEYQVSSQQDEIESLHELGKYNITSSSIINNSSTNLTQPAQSSPDKQIDFYTYSYYIENSTTSVYPDPFFTELNYTSHVATNEDYSNQVIYLRVQDSNEHGPVYYQLYEGMDANQNDIAIHITSLNANVYAKEDVTRVYYDTDMSVTSDYNYTKYRVVYDVEGYIDPAFAGYYLTFNIYHSNGTTINEDGTFQLHFSSIFGFKDKPRASDIELNSAYLRIENN